MSCAGEFPCEYWSAEIPERGFSIADYRDAISRDAGRDDLTLGGGLSVLYMGDTLVKPTPSVAGEYKDVYILFASFNVNWK